MKRALLLVVLVAIGCGSEHAAIPALVDAHAAAKSPSAELAGKLAPAALEDAKAQLALADAAQSEGRDVDAALHAERANALLERARMIARAERARSQLAEATRDLLVAQTAGSEVGAQRAAAEREGESLERRLLVLREARTIATGPADPRREAARVVAARSLLAEGRLMCAAAKLVDGTAEGLDAASAQVEAVEPKLEGAPSAGALLDAAAGARQECLRVLSRARRAQPKAQLQPADPLLAALSAAGDEPTRVERGVVVTLRDVFAGSSIAPKAKERLEALARVATAHPAAPVQIVVHDAKPTSDGQARADAVRAALLAAGAKPESTTATSAGVRLPIVDPTDTTHAARNARVEVVFVTAD